MRTSNRYEHRRSRVDLLLLMGLLTAYGCADTDARTGATGDGGAVGLEGLTALRIEPADQTLTVSNNQAASAEYRAIGRFADGSERDVTASASFQVSSVEAGIFSGNRFTSSVKRGGEIEVTATVDSASATTKLTVRLSRRFVVDGVDSAGVQAFADAEEDLTAPIDLVYPASGVLVPPNLPSLELQWTRSAQQQLFEVRFVDAVTELKVYAPCVAIDTRGCSLQLSGTLWQALVDGFAGDEPLTFEVRGLSADRQKVSASGRRALTIATGEVAGGLYYWNASTGRIMRYDFGRQGARAETFELGDATKKGSCVGCHALSHNGKRIAAVANSEGSPLKVLDVASRDLLSEGKADYISFSPDGSQLLLSAEQRLQLVDAATLAPVSGPSAIKGTMPEWSADGARVAYVQPGSTTGPAAPFSVSNGSIMLLERDAAAATWSAPRVLVRAEDGQQNNYYPTISPDGEVVIFNRVASGHSYDAAAASLWAVRTGGSGSPIDLTAANSAGVPGGGDLCNSWPKFSPFVREHRGKRLLWFTFSSRRPRGLRAVKDSKSMMGADRVVAQVWMAALLVDSAELGSAIESTPAFWLPFQEANSGNHIAQWAAKVVQRACDPDGSCPSGQSCVDGSCEAGGQQ